jgi:hypothetical protein
VHTTLEYDVVGELRSYRLKVKRREVKLVLEILRDVGELTLYPNGSWKLRGLETTVFKDQLGGVGRKMEKNSFQVLDESLMFLRRTAMEFDRRREQALLRYTDANDRARAILPDTTAECIRLVSNLHIAAHRIEMVMQGLAEAVTQSK